MSFFVQISQVNITLKSDVSMRFLKKKVILIVSQCYSN